MSEIKTLFDQLTAARGDYERLLSGAEPFPAGSSENDQAHLIIERIDRTFVALAALTPDNATDALLLQKAALNQSGDSIRDLSPAAFEAFLRVQEFLGREK